MAARVETELENLIRARYPIVYVVSWEEKRVEDTLRNIARERGKKLHIWTVTTGFSTQPGQRDSTTRDPGVALDYVLNSPDQAIFLLKDFHPYISDFQTTRRLRDLTLALKNSFKNLIILSPVLKLPSELEKEITVLDYDLPTYEDLGKLLDDIIRSVRDTPTIDTDLTPEEREQVLKAAQGLTTMEAENVFAKSLVEKRAFDIDVILSEKQQIIRKSGILEYYPANEAFKDVGGLDILKDWLDKRTVSFADKAREFGLPEPRGILLLGVQGCGKSLTAKSIGAQWRLPLLRLDIGKVFAGIVGASEENMRKAIRVAESVAPCVAGDTRIALADGSERTIEELFESQAERLRVLAMTPSWQLEPVPVNAITRRPAPDLFSIRLQHGKLQATGNHLHPTLRDGALVWVRTDELRAEDYVAIPRQIPTVSSPPSLRANLPAETRMYAEGALLLARTECQTPQRRYAARERQADYVKIAEIEKPCDCPPLAIFSKFVLGRGGTIDSVLLRLPEMATDDLGYALGLIASDGYLGKRRRVGFINTELMLHARFTEILQRYFGVRCVRRLNVVKARPALTGTTDESVFRPCFVTYADNRLLIHILKAVQADILRMPVSFLNAWLRGYFDGDGYISGEEGADPKIVLTSKRKEQNRLVRSVLHRAGFQATNPDCANIEITGFHNVRRFIGQIGSDHPCRRERMDAWMQRPLPGQLKDRIDLIPVGDLLRRARRSVGLGSQSLRSASAGLMNRYERGQGHPNRDRLRGLVEELEAVARTKGIDSIEIAALRSLVDSPIAWSRIQSITPEPVPEFVYDLVCAGPHNFIANGIVTHNCILWLDELEKGLSGTQSSGSTDGGTTARVFSTFLTWLQEKTVPVFVVSTANQVEVLPPELLRKGRFDEIFFIDLPSKEEREDIFKIHLTKRKRDPAKFDLKALAEATPGYSGAEIEQLVVEALYNAFDAERDVTTEDLIKAAAASVPLSMTMREKIAYLRNWAETRARKASSAPVETIEEQIAAQLKARALAAEQEALDRARVEAESKSKSDGAAKLPRTSKTRRVAVKKEGGS